MGFRRRHGPMTAKHVVVMGVSGSGKSTVGELLAERIGAQFLDGDTLHPKSNVAKMRAGTPLDDRDRQPWLEVIGRKLSEAGDESIVVACSALKKSYRDVLRAADPTVCFILLHGSHELFAERFSARADHFMPPSLLRSQLDTLEELHAEESGFALDIAESPDALARKAADLLSSN